MKRSERRSNPPGQFESASRRRLAIDPSAFGICALLVATALLPTGRLLSQDREVTGASLATDRPSVSLKPPTGMQETSGATSQQPKPAAEASYVLGPGDQISLLVSDLEDSFTDKIFLVDASGAVNLPFIGRVHVAGLTTGALEADLRTRLVSVLRNPEVIVNIVRFGSQPVSVLGAVNSPGIRQLEGTKSLFEVLSLAGGLRSDAGLVIQMTRRLSWGPLPLSQAKSDPIAQVSMASVKVKDIVDDPKPTENILVLPGDTISVPRADLVYAVGSVVKPGGFVLNEHESMSALEVLSRAEGVQKTAAPERAKILRVVVGSPNRVEIAVNLKQLMDGTGADVQLQPQDILFIPGSRAKNATYRSIDAIVSIATGMVIYGARF